MDPLAEIRRLYFTTTPRTIHRDLERAIALLKQLPEDQRERAAGYMDGLAQLRAEWATRSARRSRRRARRG
jgi:hypothetical protein